MTVQRMISAVTDVNGGMRCRHTPEALVLLAEQIFDRHLDVLEGDVRRAAGPDTLAVHPPRRDTTVLPLDKEQADTVHARSARANRSSEVITPNTVGDPLLLAIDDVVLAILAELRLASQVRDVRARIRLGDGQAYALVAVQDPGQDAVLETLLAEFDQGRAADAKPTNDVPDEPTRAHARDLVRDEHLMEQVPVFGGHRLDGVVGVLLLVGRSEQAGEVAAAAHLLVDGRRNFFLLVPLGHVGLDLVLDPFPNLGAESGVGLVEVGRVELQKWPYLAL